MPIVVASKAYKAGPNMTGSGKFIVRDGKLVRPTPADVRQRDNHEIESLASGVSVEQVPEMNRRFGGSGVRFDPKTGNAIYKNRKAKLDAIKKRGFHDRNEIKG